MRTLVAIAVLVASTLVGSTATGTGPASAAPLARGVDPNWMPIAGPVFNAPEGRKDQQTKIIDRIHDAIRNTPPGATIRFATYSLDRPGSALLLTKAFQRGVNVQVVANDNLVSKVERQLQAVLGTNPDAPSFLIICTAACRNSNKAGNQHMKTYSFSQTGAATDVIINSSANLSGGAVNGQWNDAYTVFGNPELFASWVTVFDQLKYDRAATPRKLSYVSDTISIAYQRLIPGATPARRESVRLQAGPTGDAALGRVKRISCRSGDGFGVNGRTRVRIAMYAWYGVRGERIARAVAARKREGCDVKVIGSVMSTTVVRILQGAKIATKAADWDFGMRLATSGKGMVYGPRCYSHLKFITINGKYKGRNTAVTFTGSENWSGPSLSSDEVTYEIHDAGVLNAYNAKWTRMWRSKKATHRVLLEPKTRPCR